MRGNQIDERNMAFASGASHSYQTWEHVTDVERDGDREENQKLSSTMAMLLGILGTLEIMIAGVMIFNIDVRAADTLALIFAFLVLYFGVVAVLTDK